MIFPSPYILFPSDPQPPQEPPQISFVTNPDIINSTTYLLGDELNYRVDDVFEINDVYDKKLSGNDGVLDANIELTTEIQPLVPGTPVWKIWMDINGKNYRAEVEPNMFEIDNYDMWFTPPSANMSMGATFGRPTGFIPSTFKVPGTLQKYGLLRLIAQLHDWDRDINGTYGVNGVTPPWSIFVADAEFGGVVGVYEKLLDGLGQTSDPLVIFDTGTNARFAAGQRLQIVIECMTSKGADGYFRVYRDWLDPANPQTSFLQLAYDYNGPTIHPNNVEKVCYGRMGNYYSDIRFYGNQIISEGSGTLDSGKMREIWYLENLFFNDHVNDPNKVGVTTPGMLNNYRYIAA